MIKTLIAFLFSLASLSSNLSAQSDYADCVVGGSGACLAAGGVVAVVTVYTNPASGEATVLPVRCKMFSDVLGNPLWNSVTGSVFGASVTVLPFQDVILPEGYPLYWTGHNNPSGYPMTYSSAYPIIVESSTDGEVWSSEFNIVLSASLSQQYICNVPGTGHRGVVTGKLWSSGGDEMMDRGAGGAEDATCITPESRGSVAILYFNLPPAVDCDRDLSTMVSGSTFKQYRVRFSGSPNCGPAGCAAPTLAAAVSGKYMALSFQTLENPSLYKVDYQKSLGTSNWLSLTPWLALPSGVQIQMFDEIVDPSRFYRLVSKSSTAP